jgi:hypothetical protein
MKINIITNNYIAGSKKLKSHIIASLTEELGKLNPQIAQLEVRLSNEKEPKEVVNDKRCVIEAYFVGKQQPMAFTNYAESHEKALAGAIDKLKELIEKKLGNQSIINLTNRRV